MKSHRFLFSVMALAVILRILVVIVCDPWSSDWEVRFVSSDAGSYYMIANNLLNHGAYSLFPEPPFEPDCNRTPVYPFFLAGMFRIFGVHVGPIFVLQSILSLGVVYLVYRIGQMFSGETAARIAAVLAAVDLYVIEFSCMLWTELLFVLWLVIIFYLIGLIFKVPDGGRRTGWLLFLLGLVLGIAVLTRPIATYLLLLLLLGYLLLRVCRIGIGIFPMNRLLFLVLGWLLAVSPWVVRNYSTFGRVGISSISGYNMLFFDGAATLARAEKLPLAEAKNQAFARYVNPEEAARVSNNCSAYAALYARGGIRIMLEHPVDAVVVHLQGVFDTFRRVDGLIPGRGNEGKWTGVRYYQVLRERGIRGLVRALREDPNRVISLFFMAHLIFLAVVYLGVILSLPAWRRGSTHNKWCYIFLVVVALYFVGLGSSLGGVRMRLPIHPIMELLAGLGLSSFWCWRKKNRSGKEEGTREAGG